MPKAHAKRAMSLNDAQRSAPVTNIEGEDKNIIVKLLYWN